MRNIFFIILLFATGFTYAQKDYTTVMFKDGKTIQGIITIKKDQLIYKKVKKGSEKIYRTDDVDHVIFTDKKGEQTLMKFVKVKEKAKYPSLLEVLVDASDENDVTLYREGNTRWNYSGSGGGYGPTARSTTTYYVKRGNEKFALRLFETGNTNSFKKRASDYFEDCSSLVQKVKAKEFKRKNVEEMIEFYNQDCQ